MNNRIVKFLTLLCLVALLISCQPRISKTNFDKIEAGMTLQEVVEILGNPSSSATLGFGESVVTSARWENRNGSIVVQLFNGKVKVKQYVQGVTTPRED